ncbi:hypothetical protein N7462_008900 [Penicillium macrosclerotiorum]|uniref:uncharacterized protein n=1 Tax=Penicillium macrosclerotiorum TaxID=303699 RepID=UPI0025493111|nr:uncharacterized protein N7462_008900 [Penicillium macrosclerotiorum]KAJ5676003.1 hypothetical protein N7462_008900 [Penicillium macrosclerotiorum]
MSYGKSLSQSQNAFVVPPSQPEEEPLETESRHSKRRFNSSLYDAVAGRVNQRGFHPAAAFASRYRDTASSGARSLRPEEVLARAQNYPTKHQRLASAGEGDAYFAHERLPSHLVLPDSSTLEAVHAYAADFYEYATDDHGLHDHQSMDETALIAMGILVEEMAKEVLGETGDLVLVEGEEVPEAPQERPQEDDETGAHSDATTISQLGEPSRRRKRMNVGATSDMATSQENPKSVQRTAKRRKLGNRVSIADAESGEDER